MIDKIRKLNAKAGPFDFAILLGVFDPQNIETTLTDLPPIISISSTSPPREELENGLVTVLGQYGIKELPKNLKIGYIALGNNEIVENSDAIVNTFRDSGGEVDIFITTNWSVSFAAKNPKVLGSEVIDEVMKMIQPRYHLTTGDPNLFNEFDPFIWPSNEIATRFINLATYQSKSKWAYAFNIETDKGTIQEVPRNLMENPYLTSFSQKRLLEKDNETDGAASAAKKIKTVLPSNCHFCFTNPNVADHMFVSISDHAYLTTAKGPLSVARGEMDFSGHCLLIPIEHIPKLNVGQKNYAEDQTVKELELYERSIVKMNYKRFDMSSVVFEIHSDRSIHFHKQLIPVPKYLIMKFEDALRRQEYLNNEKYTSNANLNFESYSSPDDLRYQAIVNDEKMNYLKFTVYETSDCIPTTYVSLIQPEDRIDLQFGRRVVAFLLRLPKRINWASPACKQTKEQEEEEVRKFQKGYVDFDIANKE